MSALLKKSWMAVVSLCLALGCTLSILHAQESVSSVPLTKEIAVSSNDVKCPNVDFSFSITPYTVEGVQKDGQGNVLSSGIEGGLYFVQGAGTVSFSSAMSAEDAVYSASTQISVDDSLFAAAAPGVYVYQVREDEVPDTAAYEGISTDDSVYTLLVYVTRSALSSTVSYVLAYRNQSKSDIVFTNHYSTNALSLTKKLSGNQSDVGKAYVFSVLIEGADNEQYQGVFSNGKTGTIQIQSGTAAQGIELMEGQTLTIYGLSSQDVYTLSEQDYSSLGYTTTVSINGGQSEQKNSVSGILEGKDVQVVFTNTKNLITPTGVFLSAAPYLALLASIGLLMLVIYKKISRFHA